jgi:hypothetical protein
LPCGDETEESDFQMAIKDVLAMNASLNVSMASLTTSAEAVRAKYTRRMQRLFPGVHWVK